jgi:glycosyltransferase involved in cell wall biosynthesis
MRILVLCYEYPPLGGGGGRVAKSIADQMVLRGHEVRVQTAALGLRSTHETIDGVEVFRTASGRRRPDTCTVFEMGLYLLTSFFPTLRHLRKWRPHVVHAHFAMPTGLLAWLARRLTGVPFVLTAHLGDVPGGVPDQTDTLFRIVGPIARRVWKRAAAATAVSSFVQELAEQAYGRKVERILNGIDLSDAPPPPQTLRPTRQLAFVGRFNPQKNLPFFIDALADLAGLDWHATIVGDGPDRALAERRITEHSLRDRITLPGWMPAARVQEILAQSDVLCLPSTSEGLPVVAIEALKQGVAIVASDIPGVRDVVDHGVNGYRLKLDDSYGKKLRALLESDETLLMMKQASYEKAGAFDLTHIADEYERVLREASGVRNHQETP